MGVGMDIRANSQQLRNNFAVCLLTVQTDSGTQTETDSGHFKHFPVQIARELGDGSTSPINVRNMRLIVFSRERLRRVLRKKTSAEEFLSSISSHLHIFTSVTSTSHLHLLIFTSAHLTFSPISLLIFTSSHIYISAHLHISTSTCSHLHISLLPGAVPPDLHLTSSPLALLNFLS